MKFILFIVISFYIEMNVEIIEIVWITYSHITKTFRRAKSKRLPKTNIPK